jgi:hypothetical protein
LMAWQARWSIRSIWLGMAWEACSSAYKRHHQIRSRRLIFVDRSAAVAFCL